MGGALRKRLPAEDLTPFSGVQHPSSDELDDAFPTRQGRPAVDHRGEERFARAMARFRASGEVTTVTDSGHQQRTLLDAVGVRDPRNLDVDRLWSPRRSQGGVDALPGQS